jgi:hypothetical protein
MWLDVQRAIVSMDGFISFEPLFAMKVLCLKQYQLEIMNMSSSVSHLFHVAKNFFPVPAR